MPFDNYVAGAVARELNTALKGGKVERVYQPSASDIILFVNTPREKARRVLLLSANSSLPRIYLSDLKSGNPQNPPAFCMLLRKHLIGGRIAEIRSVPSERIIHIAADTYSELGVPERKTLVIELMGKHSNIILLRENENPASSDTLSGGIIIDSIKRIYEDMSRVRQILPGIDYELPPPSSKMPPIIEAEFETEGTRAAWDRRAEAGDYAPAIWYAPDGAMRDFHVFPLTSYAGFTETRFASVSEMLETWFEGKESGNRLNQKTADLTRAVSTRLNKALLKKQRLLEDMNKAEKADEYRKQGDLITANIYRLERGMKSVSVLDYVDGREITIALDPLETPAQNAQRYYKKYAKAKTAKTEKRTQLELTEREIDYLESYLVWIADAKTDDDAALLREELASLGYVRRGKFTAKPSSSAPKRLTYELGNGFSVSVGRNNRENDALTMKTARPFDLWLHTKDIPGSHVVLSRTGNAENGAGTQPGRDTDPADVFGADTIRKAAGIAAYHSKARGSSNVPVDYTYIRYVKKPAGAKPGMVIFTHNKTIYVNPELP
ncbi:MAG: NFACT family protein [Clostridiales Family XIII bacterium]|jgi:predicted ribosome quality control (RQC) complex YloA/Tae2 family protein|nr:NFACT family protein [Clostridiales Family XIII bacterium]